MEVAEFKSKIEEMKGQSDIRDDVIDWLEMKVEDYDNVENVFNDLFQSGCSSGMVGHLTYYEDTMKYYQNNKDEISELLKEAIDNVGGGPNNVFGDKWDESDPLANEQTNQNLLAWFGFEETARKIADELELEV